MILSRCDALVAGRHGRVDQGTGEVRAKAGRFPGASEFGEANAVGMSHRVPGDARSYHATAKTGAPDPELSDCGGRQPIRRGGPRRVPRIVAEAIEALGGRLNQFVLRALDLSRIYQGSVPEGVRFLLNVQRHWPVVPERWMS